MTYKELLYQISEYKDFDPSYSIKHLTVDECFRNEEVDGKEWNDIADKESIQELTELQ